MAYHTQAAIVLKSLFYKELGWSAKTKLAEGLEKTLEYYNA